MPAKTIEERLQRMEDIHEIQQLMGRYPYYVMMMDYEGLNNNLFAKKDPGVKVHLGSIGYWQGVDAPQRSIGSIGSGGPPQDRTGIMTLHMPVCPVIEVAGDGKTAKGVWIGIGLLCMKNEKGEPNGAWEFDKYGVDFIKEDGRWKIWHHHIYDLLKGWNVDEKWAEMFKKQPPVGGRGVQPDGPTFDHNPYSPTTIIQNAPKPPEPYETWTDTTSY